MKRQRQGAACQTVAGYLIMEWLIAISCLAVFALLALLGWQRQLAWQTDNQQMQWQLSQQLDNQRMALQTNEQQWLFELQWGR